jgi:hypothetical protein
VSVTEASLDGAAARVKVPVLLAPPKTDAGAKLKELGTMFGVTVSVPLALPALVVAETTTLVAVATTFVATVKFALDVPDSTVTEAGIVFTAEPPLVTASVTTVSVGTLLDMVTVPMLLAPPTTLAGLNVTEAGPLPGVTVSVPFTVVPFAVAETPTLVVFATEFVVTVKVAVVAPARTVTEVGIDFMAALPLLTASATLVSETAAAFSVTVPVLVSPPRTLEGLNANEVGTTGVTVSVPVLLVPFAAAETTTLVVADTGTVVRVNVAVLLPAGTITVAGIDPTAELPLVTANATESAADAFAASVTVPVLLAPPGTDDGENVRLAGVFGSTETEVDVLPPLADAETVTVTDVVTGFVTIVNVAVELPARTVTDAGIEATAVEP